MLIHIANLIILASFLVKDVMWLRSLSVIGGCVWIGYFTVSFAEVNWSGIGWNILFTMINLWYIALLILERRPVHLTESERDLKYLIAPDLDVRSWSRLLKLGEEVSGEKIAVQKKDHANAVLLVMGGTPSETKLNSVTSVLSRGSLIGGQSLIGEPLTPAQLDHLTDSTLITWDSKRLRGHLQRRPEVEAVFQRLISDELTR